ncbi:MAG: class I SAM-dependent methyltransferase [Candidatus Wolfebacteria bacterium]|nr:class I SAM-dependent methyltransferase [Candidatus Wolfebacteria bacterium]
MENINLTAEPWKDYELIDSGDNKKLERYGKYVITRPETQALWKPLNPDAWKKCDAEFKWAEGKGNWQKNNLPESWEMSWQNIRFICQLTSFKHTGVFPEQSPNWQWLAEKVLKIKEPKILNLFGYTGIASAVAAENGGKVTHVDASKQSNVWAKKNAELSGIEEVGIRYILDDSLKFSEREVRRGSVYDGIILDPPAFGRGPKGEVWKIEEQFPRLMETLEKLLSKKLGSFFLLNGYAAGYSPQSFLQATESYFPKIKAEFGELRIKESDSERFIPSGIYVRFVR